MLTIVVNDYKFPPLVSYILCFAFEILMKLKCFWQAQIMAYVEYFGQFTSEQFPEDVAQVLIVCYLVSYLIMSVTNYQMDRSYA